MHFLIYFLLLKPYNFYTQEESCTDYYDYYHRLKEGSDILFISFHQALILSYQLARIELLLQVVSVHFACVGIDSNRKEVDRLD